MRRYGRFVDSRVIRQRMDAKDARVSAAARRRVVVPFLAPEVVPYASVVIIRAEPVAPKLRLTAREMSACLAMRANGLTQTEVLQGIEAMRAFVTAFPITGGAR